MKSIKRTIRILCLMVYLDITYGDAKKMVIMYEQLTDKK